MLLSNRVVPVNAGATEWFAGSREDAVKWPRILDRNGSSL
jgi:hypothetical protein